MSNPQITVGDRNFELMLSEKQIAEQVRQMAYEINEEYQGQDLVILGVLNGVFMFISDLVKSLEFDAPVNFIKVASYIGQRSTGKVRELVGFSGELKNRHVLVVDDILDSGFTYEFLMRSLSAKEPASIKFACLLYKPDALKVDAKPDFYGFSIPNEFVVGYGMDYDQMGRTFKEIYTEVK